MSELDMNGFFDALRKQKEEEELEELLKVELEKDEQAWKDYEKIANNEKQ